MKDSPSTVPMEFFRALRAKKYALAWQLLTQRSQEVFIDLLTRSIATPAEEIRAQFEQGENRLAKEYWQTFAKHIQLDQWLKQSYQSLGKSENQAMIRCEPSKVQLLVFLQGGVWKFGYIETFMDNK